MCSSKLRLVAIRSKIGGGESQSEMSYTRGWLNAWNQSKMTRQGCSDDCTLDSVTLTILPHLTLRAGPSPQPLSSGCSVWEDIITSCLQELPPAPRPPADTIPTNCPGLRRTATGPQAENSLIPTCQRKQIGRRDSCGPLVAFQALR